MNGCTVYCFIDVGVFDKISKVAGDLLILVITVGPNALVTFFFIFTSQRLRIKVMQVFTMLLPIPFRYCFRIDAMNCNGLMQLFLVLLCRRIDLGKDVTGTILVQQQHLVRHKAVANFHTWAAQRHAGYAKPRAPSGGDARNS